MLKELIANIQANRQEIATSELIFRLKKAERLPQSFKDEISQAVLPFVRRTDSSNESGKTVLQG